MVLAALEHKPDQYICKPFSLNQLEVRLNQCMQKKASMTPIYDALDSENPRSAIEFCDKALSEGTQYRKECLGIKSDNYLI